MGLQKVLKTYSAAQEAQFAHHLWRVYQDGGSNLDDHIRKSVFTTIAIQDNHTDCLLDPQKLS